MNDKQGNWRNNPNSLTYKKWKQKILETVFIENGIPHGDLRHLYIEFFNIEEKCSKCGLSEWFGEKLILPLDHINGRNNDNSPENLRLLCPNCHSITDTFCGKNINSGFKKVSDKEFKEALKNSRSIRVALLKCGLTPKGGNYSRAYKLLGEIK
jgi:Zn finger protein HypA/HybF involved in hydrogenase expression